MAGSLAALVCSCKIVTARSDAPEHDLASRLFVPGAGVDEDPVTGSAHGFLAPRWAARLGKDALVGSLASRRGGVVRTRLAGDRVILGGRAITGLLAELLVDA
jgi:predicted PhzF superfamily epimerase YddE/YHI9